jgi:AcrR family transcriptional regulator
MNDTSFIIWRPILTYKKTEKTEERKDGKRKLIFDTAARVFARKGYHETAVKDITLEAGISVGTFYLYFKNKEDLFEKLYDEMDEKIKLINQYAAENGAENRSVEERFSRIISSSLWAFMRYRELAKIMLIEAPGLNPRFERKYGEINSRSAAVLENILASLKQKGLIDVPDVRIAAMAFEGANGIITYWLRAGGTEDLRAWAYPLAVFLLQALKIAFLHEDVKRHTEEIFRELDEKGNDY